MKNALWYTLGAVLVVSTWPVSLPLIALVLLGVAFRGGEDEIR